VSGGALAVTRDGSQTMSRCCPIQTRTDFSGRTTPERTGWTPSRGGLSCPRWRPPAVPAAVPRGALQPVLDLSPVLAGVLPQLQDTPAGPHQDTGAVSLSHPSLGVHVDYPANWECSVPQLAGESGHRRRRPGTGAHPQSVHRDSQEWLIPQAMRLASATSYFCRQLNRQRRICYILHRKFYVDHVLVTHQK
jgi:hypothetical protein